MANYWNINMVNDERRMIGRTATALEPRRWRPYWATPRVTWGSGGHGSYSMRASGWSSILQRGGESTVIPICWSHLIHTLFHRSYWYGDTGNEHITTITFNNHGRTQSNKPRSWDRDIKVHGRTQSNKPRGWDRDIKVNHWVLIIRYRS